MATDYENGPHRNDDTHPRQVAGMDGGMVAQQAEANERFRIGSEALQSQQAEQQLAGPRAALGEDFRASADQVTQQQLSGAGVRQDFNDELRQPEHGPSEQSAADARAAFNRELNEANSQRGQQTEASREIGDRETEAKSKDRNLEAQVAAAMAWETAVERQDQSIER